MIVTASQYTSRCCQVMEYKVDRKTRDLLDVLLIPPITDIIIDMVNELIVVAGPPTRDIFCPWSPQPLLGSRNEEDYSEDLP